MSLIANTMLVTPANAFGVIDNSPYCGAILTYDSDTTELLEDVFELSSAMGKYFASRCEVGLLDFAYPSNMISFERFYSNKPSLWIRRPLAHHTMFNYKSRKDLHRTSKLIAMDSKYWGQIIPYEELVKDPVKSFELVDVEYEKMSDSHKISIMYETKNKQPRPSHKGNDKWTLLYGREIYEKLFTDIMREIQEHVMEKSKSVLAKLEYENDMEGHLAKQYLNVQMDNQVAATDLQKELEKRYETLVMEEKAISKDPRVHDILLDPVLDPPVQLLPVTKPTLEPLIPTWNRKRNEL